ncbi:hypothetical protein ERX46_17285 [Brumimicrobium glaciale]|uniref:Bacteriophage abortive infection AbiH n=1 Tax=Brumimicrobium glaciale TaxID=200475 RepID=A0A4Q4KD91_9FLAO|nr:AbiH family protein [Brumimicrobium glaciale]RYM30835.1 hypothetical protein ERX46_17285 [Brumimicrobium glaciale]
MNRIILIGNGFDLAHGLKTSYRNFIDDYWQTCINKCNDSKRVVDFEDDFIQIKDLPVDNMRSKGFKDLLAELKSYSSKLIFKNQFLEVISKKSGEINWVDIENEYYSLLKKELSTGSENSEYQILTLNKDFEGIKNLLIEYLKGQEEIYNKDKGSDYDRIKDQISNKTFRPFEMRDFSENAFNVKAEIEYRLIKKDLEGLTEDDDGNTLITMDEVDESKRRLITQVHGKNNPKSEIKYLLSKSYAHELFDLVPDNILFLNFNYTSTDKLYQYALEYRGHFRYKVPEFESIHIHGTITQNDGNPVIFGFGDELDDDYKSIEKLNNNIYLENIKSINYLETDNYKKLLEYINSAPFQVFIFGHSCGTSDRTMLNTMFEHDNCASIKLFYHQQDANQDNYSDVIRNISRNFNDKAKMRDRVVNKRYCERLV